MAVMNAAAAASTTTTLAVTGMTCSHCVAAITDGVSKLDAVVAVSVDLASGSVMVESNGPVDPAALVAAIDEAGYEVAG
jgi:copper chaperone